MIEGKLWCPRSSTWGRCIAGGRAAAGLASWCSGDTSDHDWLEAGKRANMIDDATSRWFASICGQRLDPSKNEPFGEICEEA